MVTYHPFWDNPGVKWGSELSKCALLPILHDKRVKMYTKGVFRVADTMVAFTFGTWSHIAHFGTTQGGNGEGGQKDQNVPFSPYFMIRR